MDYAILAIPAAIGVINPRFGFLLLLSMSVAALTVELLNSL